MAESTGKKWRHRLIVWTTTIVVAVLFLVVLPLGIRFGAVAWLESHGVEQASIEDVDLNLFSGEFVLKHLSAGEGLKIDRLIINIDWMPLIKKIIYIRTFELEGSNLHLHQQGSDPWQVAEIKLPPGEPKSEAKPEEKSGSPWLVVVDNLNINQFLLQVKNDDMVLELPLETLQLSLSGLENREQKVAKRLEIGETRFSGFGYKVRNQSFKMAGNLYFSVTADDILASLNSQNLEIEIKGFELLDDERMPLAWVDTLNLAHVAVSGTKRHKVGAVVAENLLVQPALSGSGSFQMNRLAINDLDADLAGKISLSSLGLEKLTAAGVTGKADVLRIGQLTTGRLEAEQEGRATLASLKLQRVAAVGLAGGGDTLNIEEANFGKLEADAAGSVQLAAVKLAGLAGTGLAGGKDSVNIKSIDLGSLQADKSGSVQLATAQLGSLAANNLPGSDQDLGLAGLDLAAFSLDAEKNIALDNLNLHEFSLRQRGGSQLLGAINQIELQKFAMAADGKGEFDSLALQGISLPAAGRQSLGSIGAMTASGARIDTAGSYHLRRLSFSRLRTSLIKTQDGKMAVLDELGGEEKQDTPATGAPASKGKKKSEKGPSVVVDLLTIGRGSEIHYRDETLKPVLENRLKVNRFRLAPFDLSGRRAGKLDVDMQINKAGSLAIKGTMKPADSLATDLKVAVKNVDMIGFSGFIEGDFGKTIKTGQLNLDSDIKIADNRLDSKNKLLLRKLQLADSEQPAAAEKSVGMPIDMALDMMRDDRGDIEMDVPVSGALDDPNIGLNAIINKALMIAMRAGAMTYATMMLQPYGSIMLAADIASGMVKKAARPKLTPVGFAAKQATLSPEMEDYLSKIGELLKTKDFRLQICGVATRSEAEPAPVPEPEAGKRKSEPEPPLTDEQLLQLAEGRADLVMERLSGQGIGADRLFSCKAAIEEKKEGSAPRVDLLLD